jgi:hypothetical protein
MIMPDVTLRCEKCGSTLSRCAAGKVKLMVKSRLIAFGEDGVAELVCPVCYQDTRLPSIRIRIEVVEKNA